MAKSYKEALAFVEAAEARFRKEGAMQIDTKLEWKAETITEWLLEFFYYSLVYTYDSGGKYPYKETNRIGGNNVSKEKSFPNRRRSLGDIFKLAITHFKSEVTLLEVMQGLWNIDTGEKQIKLKDRSTKYEYYIYSTICSTVRRRVFYIANRGSHTTYGLEVNSRENDAGSDEPNITKEDYRTLCDASYAKQKLEEEKRRAEQEEAARINRENARIAKEKRDAELEAAKLKKQKDLEELDRLSKANLDKAIEEKIAKLMAENSSLVKVRPVLSKTDPILTRQQKQKKAIASLKKSLA